MVEETEIKEVKVDDPLKELEALEKQASWLTEGERVEVVYGEFWKVKTPRTDNDTGKPYATNDYKIGCKNEDGDHVFRLVNKYDWKRIMDTFKAKMVNNKMPQSVWFERPRADRGYRRRGRY